MIIQQSKHLIMPETLELILTPRMSFTHPRYRTQQRKYLIFPGLSMSLIFKKLDIVLLLISGFH